MASHLLELRVLNKYSKYKKAILFLVALLWHKCSLILHFVCGTTVEDIEIVLSLPISSLCHNGVVGKLCREIGEMNMNSMKDWNEWSQGFPGLQWPEC